jgi:hypothetical protein
VGKNISMKNVQIPHALLSLEGEAILQHPKLGFSWEGFIIEQLMIIYYFKIPL